MSFVSHVAAQSVAAFTTWGFTLFGLLLLAAVVGHEGIRTRIVVPAAVGAVAAALAAGVGLLVKDAVAERRPCQVHPSPAAVTHCPAPGDWSFPSNHAVFAGALAVTLVVVARIAARPWIAAVAIAVAVAIATSRVLLGVHYWWDVVAGLGWGALLAGGMLATIAPLATAAALAHGERRRRAMSSSVR